MPRVYFKEENCKGCCLCIKTCPKKIIIISDKLNNKGYHTAAILEENMKQCTGCASCARICPDVVIKIEK